MGWPSRLLIVSAAVIAAVLLAGWMGWLEVAGSDRVRSMAPRVAA